jgi:hypothetical protein
MIRHSNAIEKILLNEEYGVRKEVHTLTVFVYYTRQLKKT